MANGNQIILWASRIGGAPEDTLDMRLRRAILVISTLLISVAGLLWGGTYLALGAQPAGFVPIGYSALSAVSISVFLRTGNFARFRTVQLCLILCLPVMVQVLLGGFAAGSAVIVWAILAPLGALMFGARSATGWFVAFVGAAALCGLAEGTLAVHAPPLPGAWRTAFFVMNVAAPSTTAYVMLRYLVRGEEQLRLRIREHEEALERAKQLGPYTLEGKLGAGGMGVVYRARHALLRRPTAIKMLPIEKVGELSLRRFEREVQLTATLSHPNTVAIHDYGRSTDGVFYYAMELLDGVDLETLVKQTGPLPPERVVYILEQVCGALDEAHHRGLVHRDIKPANIMLCRLGNRPDVAKVLDFGLVKDLAPSADDKATCENTIAGTPAYIAPETILDPASIGPRADLYALGGVAYWLLTGRTVFRGSVIEIFAHHMHTTPEPPSHHTNGLPDELEEVVLRCLEKKESARPVSAKMLKRLLKEVPLANAWTEEAAHAWWDAFEKSPVKEEAEPVSGTDKTLQVDLRDRVEMRARATLM